VSFRERLIATLSDRGPCRPSDLDEALLGRLFLPGIGGALPPYGDDLGDLAEAGIVRWYRSDKGDVWYELVAHPAQTPQAEGQRK